MTSSSVPAGLTPTASLKRYRLPGITREGIAQLSLLETALWPLHGGSSGSATFDATYTFKAGEEQRPAHVSVYAPLGLQSIDEFLLWGLLALTLSRPTPEPALLATPYWIMKRLGMGSGGFQYDQFRASLERLALVAYQNTAFYNPITQQHERVTFHFLSSYLPTNGAGGEVASDRGWRIEWSPMFFQMCQATGGTLLFDLDTYRQLSPASRRLFLKLKDRFWRQKKVFMNVDDLTINGLGFSADRPLKKRKFDLTRCIRELLKCGIIELGTGQADPKELFLKRGKGSYVVVFHEGEYFRQPLSERVLRQQDAMTDDPLYEPLRRIGVDAPAIRRLFKEHSRGVLHRWIRITDAAMHEHPRGFPGFKTSPAAFLIDGIQHSRMPPDWVYAHEKERERIDWECKKAAMARDETPLRKRYEQERASALQTLLASADGRGHVERYRLGFLPFYQAVEPDRCEEKAQEAAMQKAEREHFVFPEFGVWLLQQHQQSA